MICFLIYTSQKGVKKECYIVITQKNYLIFHFQIRVQITFIVQRANVYRLPWKYSIKVSEISYLIILIGAYM